MPFPDLRPEEVEQGEAVDPQHPSATDATTWASFVFAGATTPSGTISSGNVGTERSADGSDGADFGTTWVRHRVPIADARAAGLELDKNGAQLTHSPVDKELPNLDFMDQADVLEKYYPHCCKLVQEMTGASEVYAFDHNVRSRSLKTAGAQISGGNAVQGPAAVVHNDYTITAAPRRLEQLATKGATSANDTLRRDAPVVPAETLAAVNRGGRWAMINVWRNILPEGEAVARTPLAVVDGASVKLDAASDEIVTFEIRYADRIGENYSERVVDTPPRAVVALDQPPASVPHGALLTVARCAVLVVPADAVLKHKPEQQRFFYFPAMMRSEALAIKVWDSASSAVGGEDDHIAPFSFHSAFDEESPDKQAPDRQSIEVRTIAFFSAAEESTSSGGAVARL